MRRVIVQQRRNVNFLTSSSSSLLIARNRRLYSSKTTESAEQANASSAHGYFLNRVAQLQSANNLSLQKSFYPNSFPVTKTLEKYRENYDRSVESSQKLFDVEERISGRVFSVRKSSSKLHFITVHNGDGTHSVQIMLAKQWYHSESEFDQIVHLLKRGDHVGVIGHPAKTGTGELSIIAKAVLIVSPCLHPLPDSHSSSALLDTETRYRNRSLDLIVHHDSLIPHFQTRSNILSFLRVFLQNKDFVEVETPILALQSGGAAARPFLTHLNSFGGDVELKLRIAPELYLKELVIGGMDRVFELGKVFRNEGVDATHNPEFTSCELYMAYANYNDMMNLTEELFRSCAKFLHILKNKKKVGSGVLSTALQVVQDNAELSDETGILRYTVEDKQHGKNHVIDIDLRKPFKRISYLDAIEEETGQKIPRGDLLTAQSTITQLRETCSRYHISLDSTRVGDVGYLLDKLLSHLVEPKCIQPTFICDHPAVLSPLAKSREDDPSLTERFELFIAGRELCNSYTELNDPLEQRKRFEQQVKAKEQHGDVEAHEKDENFCKALELGLPPTAGWGCGIDRLVMLLTDSWNIRDVLLFPFMKEKAKSAEDLTNKQQH